MTFYKVKPQYDGRPGDISIDKFGNECSCQYLMRKHELLTQRELDLYRIPKCATQKVEVSKKNTFFFEGCRYDAGEFKIQVDRYLVPA